MSLLADADQNINGQMVIEMIVVETDVMTEEEMIDGTN